MERTSSNAGKCISQSQRLGSMTSCESAWNKWTSWHVRETVDPFCVPLSTIVNYLSTLFDEDLQYQTVNSQRAVISALMENQLANIQKFVHYQQEPLMKDRHNHVTLPYEMLT